MVAITTLLKKGIVSASWQNALRPKFIRVNLPKTMEPVASLFLKNKAKVDVVKAFLVMLAILIHQT
jgi:hypothetical protein